MSNENLISEVLVMVKHGDEWSILASAHVLVENVDDVKSAVEINAL